MKGASKQTPDPNNSTAPESRHPVLKFLDLPLFILIKYSTHKYDIYPSSPIGNAPTTDPKAPGSTITVGGFFFHFFLKQYERKT